MAYKSMCAAWTLALNECWLNEGILRDSLHTFICHKPRRKMLADFHCEAIKSAFGWIYICIFSFSPSLIRRNILKTALRSSHTALIPSSQPYTHFEDRYSSRPRDGENTHNGFLSSTKLSQLFKKIYAKAARKLKHLKNKRASEWVNEWSKRRKA